MIRSFRNALIFVLMLAVLAPFACGDEDGQAVEFTGNTGLPTVYINIDETKVTVEEMNSSTDHSVRCTGTIDIRVPEGFCSEYQTAENAMQSQSGLALEYIRGRGNSTWSPEIAKKPYRLKLAEKADLFGMGKNANYILLANRMDNSLLRNRITYWLTGESGMGMEFSPQCVPVDVVMNGEYYGNYLLCENITVDENRIAIDKLGANDSDPQRITGGYLLSMASFDDEITGSFFVTKRGSVFVNDTPDFAGYKNDAQKQYIRGYIQATEDAIFGDGFRDEYGVSYTEYMDLDSAVDYWWLQELSVNGDAYNTDSTYLYKKRDGKLYWGPPWDFDYVAWGNRMKRVSGFDNTPTPWFDRLFDDPVFVEKLLARWAQLDPMITQIVREGGLLDQYYDQTRVSQGYDNAKYGYYTDDPDEPVPDRTYRDEIEELRSWLIERQAWINGHLGKLEHQVKNVEYVVDGVVVGTVRYRGKPSGLPEPEDPRIPGCIFTGWSTEPHGGVDKTYLEELEENTTFYAQFADESEVEAADTILFFCDKKWVSVYETLEYLDYSLLPEEAEFSTRVSWISSDPSIAEVGQMGHVSPHSTGTVTITARLPKGETARFELTVYDPVEIPAVPVEAIAAEQETVTVAAGGYIQNRIILKPDGRPVETVYLSAVSDDPDVAYADGNGVVHGVRPGSTAITVSSEDPDLSCTFNVIVTGG